jgi:SAM-dependent methyltransferase
MFVQMDGRSIPFREEYDLVAALDVIEHIHEDQLVLNNLHRALKPGGWALISVPQHEWLWSAVDEYSCHVRRYRRTDLHHKVRAAGFEIIRSTSFAFLTLPIMILSRFTYHLRQRDPSAEHRLPKAIDNTLGLVLGIERALIRLRLNLPIGGSRIVLARKAPL